MLLGRVLRREGVIEECLEGGNKPVRKVRPPSRAPYLYAGAEGNRGSKDRGMCHGIPRAPMI